MLLELLIILCTFIGIYTSSLIFAIPYMIRAISTGIEHKHRTRIFNILIGFLITNLGFLIWNICSVLIITLEFFEIPPTQLFEAIILLFPQVIALCIFLCILTGIIGYFGYYLMYYHMPT